jgi:Plasmid pRiA4b ORF-3-like protein
VPPARSHVEYTLYIRLAEIEPAIWRRIVVPGQLTLHQLHQVLQVTMGWTHSISISLSCLATIQAPTTASRVQLHGEYVAKK